MTNREAIEILKIERDHMTPTLITERIEAMDMAISVLQEQELSKNSPKLDKENGDLQPTCNQLATDTISRQAAIDALNEYFARIGKLKRRGLTKGEKAISLDTVGAIKNLPPVKTIPISWIEAKIELVNSLPGVSMLKMKTADWRDLVEQWKAEQRNPEVDHDAQIREFAEEMSKHGCRY